MKVKMQFFIEESESYEWFEGVVQYYDKRAIKYAVYFRSDDETFFVDSDESDIEIVQLGWEAIFTMEFTIITIRIQL